MKAVPFDTLRLGDLWTYAPSPYKGWENDAVENPVFRVLSMNPNVGTNIARGMAGNRNDVKPLRLKNYGDSILVRRYNDRKGRWADTPVVMFHKRLTGSVYLLDPSSSYAADRWIPKYTPISSYVDSKTINGRAVAIHLLGLRLDVDSWITDY